VDFVRCQKIIMVLEVSFGDSRQFLGREGWGKSEGQTENTSPMMLEKPPF